MKNPFIVGETIYLRGLTEEDVHGNWFNWFNDPEVCHYNNHFRFPNTKEKMLSFLKHAHISDTILALAVIYNDGDVHIGNISLQNIDWINRSAELAIVIGEKEYWGKGLGYEASKLLVRHGFEELNLIRIYCGMSEKNIGMQRIAIKLEMQEEGRRRKTIYRSGNYHDYLDYAIVKDV